MDPHTKLLLALSDILRNSGVYPHLEPLHAEVVARVAAAEKELAHFAQQAHERPLDAPKEAPTAAP